MATVTRVLDNTDYQILHTVSELAVHTPGGVTAAEVSEVLGISTRRLLKRLHRLVDEGYLVKASVMVHTRGVWFFSPANPHPSASPDNPFPKPSPSPADG